MKYLAIVLLALVAACTEQQAEGEPGTVVFQFSSQLPHAEIWTEYINIDFGTSDARRYLKTGWSHDESNNNHTWVWAQSKQAELNVPLIPARDAEAYQLDFLAWPVKFAESSQAISISVNGSAVQTISMRAGPNSYSVNLPVAFLKRGANTLSFGFAQAISPASRRPASKDNRELAVAFRSLSLTPSELGKTATPAPGLPMSSHPDVSQPGGTSIRYRFEIPAQARFRADLSLDGPDNAGTAHVRLWLENGEARTLFSGQVSNNSTEIVDYDLSLLAGEQVLLELAVDEGQHSILWGNPAVVSAWDCPPASSLKQAKPEPEAAATDPKKPFIAPGLRYEKVLEGGIFVAMALHNNTLFVAEKQTGIISIFRDGAPGKVPVVDFDVDGFNERGLLGLALHPDYPQKPYLYAYYSASLGPAGEDSYEKGVSESINRLVRLTLENEVSVSEQVLHVYDSHALGYHNGGTLRFDSEGALWLGIGDTLRLERTQNLSLPQGKMHRYTEDGGPWPNNHFALDEDESTLDSIYALGLRNPWHFAFHPVSGSVYTVDIGHNIGDELNILENGANYGWPEVEGMADGWKELRFANETPMYRNPIWESGLRSTCPSAVAIARGEMQLKRHIVWGDCNRPWRIQAAGLSGLRDQFLASDPVDLVRMHGRPVNMMWDTNGDLLVVTMDAEGYDLGGSIRRLSISDVDAFSHYMQSHIPNRVTRIDGESWSDFGRRLYEEKSCVNCHSSDGSRMSGPSFKGIFETERALEGGGSVLVDHKYIVESIVSPGAKVAHSYSAIMPSYDGKLDEDQLLGLSHFIKSLR